MFQHLKSDLRASIVVFLVALPLCLGIALASQAPLAAGLIAGIIGGIVVAAISGSSLSVSGPAAGLAVIVASGIQEMGDFGMFTTAVFLSGIIQIFFSLAKAGVIGNFFPSSVIKGMLSAIGLILILKQFPHAVGFDSNYMGSESFLQADEGQNTFQSIINSFNVLDLECVLISVLSLLIILGWDRLSAKISNPILKSIPSALLAVIAGTVVNDLFFEIYGLGLKTEHLVQLPFKGGFSEFFNEIKLPNWSALSQSKTYVVAVTVAIVGSLESLLSLDAADKIDPEKRTTSKNQELLAQGVGNSLSGLMGGLPITAVIVRTSANVNAGAKTKLSAILHGLWILMAILFIPGLMNKIPISVLAVVLILVGYKLTKPELYQKMYKKGFNQFIPFVVTIVAILLTDLLKGIIVGMVVGFIFVIRRSNHKAMVMVKDDEKQNYLIRFTKDISFLHKHELMVMFRSIPSESFVTIDGSGDIFIDDDIVDLIEDFMEGAPLHQVNVELRKSKSAICPLFRS